MPPKRQDPKPSDTITKDLCISWHNYRGRLKTVDFTEFSDLGPVVCDLVDAFRRRAPLLAAITTSAQVGELRRFCSHLLSRGLRGLTLDSVTADHVLSFATSGTVKSQAGKASSTLTLVNEARSYQNLLLLAIPFAQRLKAVKATPTETIPDDNLDRVLRAARKEATLFWSEFAQANSSEATEIMREVADHARRCGGVLPARDSDRAFNHFEERYVYRSGKLSRRQWHRWLYATNESLLPFVILIAYGLAGNVHAVFDLKRSSITEYMDVIRGPRVVVKLIKGRSRREIGYGFRDAGVFSVPTLIRRVLAMTAPLVGFMRDEDKDALFLALSTDGNQKAGVRRLWPTSLAQRLRGFITRHSLEPFDFAQLRTTRINRTYLKSGNILLASKIARHRSLKTTVDYLNHLVTAQHDKAIIADAQREIADGGYMPKSAMDTREGESLSAARSAERDCKNPEYPPSGAIRTTDGLCRDWMFPLTDPGLIIPEDAEFLAALLRDRDELRAAKLRINTERFSRLYAPKLEIIESEILPRFSDEVLSKARALIPSLPLARRLA